MNSYIKSKDISLAEILASMRRGRWLILAITACFVLGSLALVLLVPKEYEASTVLSVVSHGDRSGLMGSLGSLASQFGGLAELAGVSTQGGSNRSDTIAALQSEALTQIYFKRNELLPILFAKQWDSEKHVWKRRMFSDTPTLWKANKVFQKVRTVALDNKTGLVTLFIRWKDPELAAAWANGLVKLTNEYLRDKVIRESDANIAYLKDEASKTDAIGLKQAIYSLLQKEIGEEMIARGSDEYALKIIDPAFVPEKAVSPKPVLWVSLGLALGLMLSIIVVVIRDHA